MFRLSRRHAGAILLLVIVLGALYAPFLRNPLVFDDHNFFGEPQGDTFHRLFSFAPRWVGYATLEWTRSLLEFMGVDLSTGMPWLRGGNLMLHAANAILLFYLLQRLLDATLPAGPEGPAEGGTWHHALPAFGAAAIFALHPASVYAVAYLIQRTILLASFFTLISWYLFLTGALGRNAWRLAFSVVAYLLAILSKEHAIMAPAVALAMLFVARPLREWPWRMVLATCVGFALAALYIVLRFKSGGVLGQAYEPRAPGVLALLAARFPGFDPALAYPLSMLTQAALFFKYLLVWVLPNPAWMAVDMFEPFALRFLSWPHLAGAVAFLAYGAAAAALLRRRGRAGLFGLALLAPWLLFATEFSTVRVQETFVLYRSYLWMPLFLLILPLALSAVPLRRVLLLLVALLAGLLMMSWNRLETFSSPLLLWNDAARLVEGKGNLPGIDRIYHNRGLQLTLLGYLDEALIDLDRAIAINPAHQLAYNDRGAAWLAKGEPAKALADFNKSIALRPDFSRAYLGRAIALARLGRMDEARQDHRKLCTLGYASACALIEPVRPVPGAGTDAASGR